jgi:succinate dehydrogenase / fumarate reductase, membrane anchor subunit
MAIKARNFKDARSQASSNPELVWWVFMRLSGTFLVVLTFFHLFNNYIFQSELGWDYDSVVYKYSDITEKLYLLALLTLGLAHGTNGLRYVIDDTTSRSPQSRFWIKVVSYTVIAAILIFGVLALLIPPVPKP